MKEIVVLAPIQDLFEKAVEIVKEHKYSNVDVCLGSMSEGVEVAKKAIEDGAEIIVTRGGTYQLVKEKFSVPVIEIKVSAYDIIESFEKVKNPKEVIGVVGYSNVVYGFDILLKILKYNMVKIELKNESDIYQVIAEHKKRGINTYIGDANIIKIIKSLDCKGILIHSQKDSVLTAIQEARRVLNVTREEKRKAQQIETITDFVHDAIIAIDDKEVLTVYNKMAEQVFGVSRSAAIGHYVSDVIPNTKLPEVLKTAKAQIGEIQNIGSSQIATNRVPIVVSGEVKGAVATFQDITEMQYIEQKIRRSLNDKGFVAKYTFDDIIYKSEKIKECIAVAKEYSKYDTPVHICGASGVGKELFCQSMHNISARSNGPFVAVNCAAIPPSLIESEFFGYEEGSFTGAKRKGKPGMFELAHNGTLFLDEISEIPMELQGRLLRVLQEKQVMRIGGNKIIPINVKIITASNKYLKREMRDGNFRKDLYYRINVLTLRIPSLNRRKEDIMVLAKHFMKKYSEKYNKQELVFSNEIENYLVSQEYEGNIRELEGIIEKCVIVSSFDTLLEESHMVSCEKNEDNAFLTDAFSKKTDLKLLNDSYIKYVFEKTGNNIQKTCDILKINRSTLWRKLK